MDDKKDWQTRLKKNYLPPKYRRSIKDFLIVNGLVCLTCFLFFIFLDFVFSNDQYNMTGIGNCGTPRCIDQ